LPSTPTNQENTNEPVLQLTEQLDSTLHINEPNELPTGIPKDTNQQNVVNERNKLPNGITKDTNEHNEDVTHTKTDLYCWWTNEFFGPEFLDMDHQYRSSDAEKQRRMDTWPGYVAPMRNAMAIITLRDRPCPEQQNLKWFMHEDLREWYATYQRLSDEVTAEYPYDYDGLYDIYNSAERYEDMKGQLMAPPREQDAQVVDTTPAQTVMNAAQPTEENTDVIHADHEQTERPLRVAPKPVGRSQTGPQPTYELWIALTPNEQVMSPESYRELANYPAVTGKDKHSPWRYSGVNVATNMRPYSPPPAILTNQDVMQQTVGYAAFLLEDENRCTLASEELYMKILIHPASPRLSWAHVLATVIRGARTMEDIITPDYQTRWCYEHIPSFAAEVQHDRVQALKHQAYSNYQRCLTGAEAEVRRVMRDIKPQLKREHQEWFDRLRKTPTQNWHRITPDYQDKNTRDIRVVPEQCESDLHFFRMATVAKHPYAIVYMPDVDCQRAAFVTALKEQDAEVYQEVGLKMAARISTICEKYQEKVQPFRPHHAERVAPKQRTIALDVIGRLMEWPDKELGFDLYWGFRIISKIEPSQVFPMNKPEILSKEMLDIDSGIDEWHADLLSKRKYKRGDATIRWKSNTEADRNESAGPYRFEEVNEIFGTIWRAMPRFATWSAGRWREVDDGKRSLHNACTYLIERIQCEDIMSPDRYSKVVYYFWQRLPKHMRSTKFQLHGFTEDLKRAYRQCAVALEHLRYSVIAWRCNNEVTFTVLLALAFGLSSAVLQFNRVSRFLTHAVRRYMLFLVMNYYDDFCGLATPARAPHNKASLYSFIENFGLHLDKGKGSEPGPEWKWLGAMKKIVHDIVYTSMEDERIRDMIADLHKVAESNYMSPSLAGKLFGKYNFITIAFAHKAGRAAIRPFCKRQYLKYEDKDWRLTQQIWYAIQWMIKMMNTLPQRVVYLWDKERPMYGIFTDASAEPAGTATTAESSARVHLQSWNGIGPRPQLTKVILGWISFGPDKRPQGGYTEVPEWIILFWEKMQPIAPGELLGGFQGLLQSDIPDHSDVILWLDNQVATSTLIKGSCRDDVCDSLVSSIHLWCAFKRIRLFIEWVASENNVADAPSRKQDSQVCTCPAKTLADDLIPPRPPSLTTSSTTSRTPTPDPKPYMFMPERVLRRFKSEWSGRIISMDEYRDRANKPMDLLPIRKRDTPEGKRKARQKEREREQRKKPKLAMTQQTMMQHVMQGSTRPLVVENE